MDPTTYDCLVLKGDSRLIINFGNGSYKPKVDALYRIITDVRDAGREMRKRLHYMHIPRLLNATADNLGRLPVLY